MPAEVQNPSMNENSSIARPKREPGVPGHWVVLGIFAFAILVTASMWTYMHFHHAPFRPLRQALTEEFSRKSAPRVEGGRHRHEPTLLRVVLNVDFNPTEDTPAVHEKVAHIEQRVIALAREHQQLEQYEKFQLFLVHPVPEQAPEQLEIKRDVADLAK
jgi:hypothetical protein